MSAYSKDFKSPSKSQKPEQPEQKNAEAPIAVDGFQQVLEMLRIADPAFRDSLLKRLEQKDRALARSLRQELGL